MTESERQRLRQLISDKRVEQLFVTDTHGRRQLKKIYRTEMHVNHSTVGGINHGSTHAYKHHGCRCRICCEAMTIRAREQRIAHLERRRAEWL